MAKKKATPTVCGPGEDWEWKVRSAADTLMRAEEIRRDDKLHAAAVKELGKRQKEVTAALKQHRGAARPKDRKAAGRALMDR